MTSPDDQDYTDDAADEAGEVLPDVTEPSSIPADEGDANAVNKEVDK